MHLFDFWLLLFPDRVPIDGWGLAPSQPGPCDHCLTMRFLDNLWLHCCDPVGVLIPPWSVDCIIFFKYTLYVICSQLIVG